MKIHESVIIYPGVVIEDNVQIGPYVVIGAPAQTERFYDQPGKGVLIKSGTRIWEHVSIHAGTTNQTVIGQNCHIYAGAHIGHDVVIEDNCKIVAAKIGGHTYIMKGANIGLGAAIHQRQIIGSFCMIGGNSFVTKSLNCYPGEIYAGCPAEYIGPNRVGLQRHNVSGGELELEIDRFKSLRGLL